MRDPYERSAEFLDVMIAETWAALAPALGEVLGRVPARTGAVVDLGAGSGRVCGPSAPRCPATIPYWPSSPRPRCAPCCSPGCWTTPSCAAG
ncbi:hypothetical protein NKH77_04475 [Streptomyces sp. M19]